MSCKEILVFVALFAIAAAAVKQEPRHPPNHNHHGHGHHGHDAVPADLLDPEVAPIKMTPEQPPLPEQDEIVEEEENEDVERQEDFEDAIDEEVSEDSRNRQEEMEDEEGTIEELRNRALWVDCDYSVVPRVSCQDCQTRVLCKYPGGGKLVHCKNPLKPYCFDGYCSDVPNDDCA